MVFLWSKIDCCQNMKNKINQNYYFLGIYDWPGTLLRDKVFISLNLHGYKKWLSPSYVRVKWHSESVNYFSRVSQLPKERAATKASLWLLNICSLTSTHTPSTTRKWFYFMPIKSDSVLSILTKKITILKFLNQIKEHPWCQQFN